jgi:hypothetical protein
MAAPPTFYSNVVNVRTTPSELVLEFGAIFPEGPPTPGKPISFEPEVRVVLTLPALKIIADVLQKALAQVEGAQKEATSLESQPVRNTSKQ